MKTISRKIIHPLKGPLAIEDLDELEALLILTSIPNLGTTKIRILVQNFESAKNALLANPQDIADLPGFGTKIIPLWQNWPETHEWKNNLSLISQHKASVIPYNSPLYPKRLLDIPDHPVLLYIKGELKPCDIKCIAIVGTRQASIYGNEMANILARDLASYGYTIVSGLARGIDTSAHIGALDKGRTIAVIGSGLADIYPSENKALAAKIGNQGVVMSEFPMATPPDRLNFPQRNRIVSGMTLGTVLIEAPLKSGAMITMEKGLSQGKKLFALPGRVDMENFRGNHALIKSGRAQLIENAEDIVQNFENLFSGLKKTTASVSTAKIVLEKEEQELMNIFPAEEISFEEIIQLSKLPVMKLNVILMGLVLKRVLKEFPGKIYKKVFTNNGAYS